MKKTFSLLLAAGFSFGLAAEVILKDDFSANAPGDNVPAGWKRYHNGPNQGKIAVADRGGDKREVILEDSCPQSENGITRTFPAVGGKKYRAGIKARALDPERTDLAYFQLRFLPSNKLVQEPVSVFGSDDYAINVIGLEAPAGTTNAQIFVYSHNKPQPAIAIAEFILEDADNTFAAPTPWPGENILLVRDSFRKLKLDEKTGAPVNWNLYAQGPQKGVVAKADEADGATALKLSDAYNDSEIGVMRFFKVTPGMYYRAKVSAKASAPGFLIQISFTPDAKNYKQTFFAKSDDYKEYVVDYQAPEDAKGGYVYIYSHKAPVSEVSIRDFSLESSPVPFN
ncbi:MAG: carbohydrate binding domain-containing protein [Victivallaceae bacterium]